MIKRFYSAVWRFYAPYSRIYVNEAMKKILIFLLSLVSMTTFAQNSSKMSEKERNEKLVKTAKEAVQKYAPDYLKYTNGDYKITFAKKDSSRDNYEDYYIVQFTDYNKEDEYFYYFYAVNVCVWAENGIAWAVGEGHGNGLLIPEKPLTRGEPVRTLKYERRSPPKIINGKVVYD